MEKVIPEYNLDEVLGLLTSITSRLTNIKTNILEIQVEQQKVIIKSLKGGYNN